MRIFMSARLLPAFAAARRFPATPRAGSRVPPAPCAPALPYPPLLARARRCPVAPLARGHGAGEQLDGMPDLDREAPAPGARADLQRAPGIAGGHDRGAGLGDPIELHVEQAPGHLRL